MKEGVVAGATARAPIRCPRPPRAPGHPPPGCEFPPSLVGMGGSCFTQGDGHNFCGLNHLRYPVAVDPEIMNTP